MNYGKVNLYELCGAKQRSIKLGKVLETVKDVPINLTDGHIAEIAFCGMMGILQDYYNEKGIYFFIKVTKDLDKNGIDVMINKLPIQIKSQYGNYPQLSRDYAAINVLWLSYDNKQFNKENIAEILNKLGLPSIPDNIQLRMNHLWVINS